MRDLLLFGLGFLTVAYIGMLVKFCYDWVSAIYERYYIEKKEKR